MFHNHSQKKEVLNLFHQSSYDYSLPRTQCYTLQVSPEQYLYLDLEEKVGALSQPGLLFSLLLVILGIRPGTYFVFDERQLIENILPVIEKYSLNIGIDPLDSPLDARHRYLITKEQINFEQFANNHDMYLAEILGYGCIDPNWSAAGPRVHYHFSVIKTNPTKFVPIFSYVCSSRYEQVADQYNLWLANTIQPVLSKIDSDWTVSVSKGVEEHWMGPGANCAKTI